MGDDFLFFGGNPVARLTNYEKVLILVFLVSLPLANPWVRGDGVGYYALARAPLIQHDLDFRSDWLNANESFRMSRVTDQGGTETINPEEFTVTGHLNNHFSIGPAILWSPFLLVAHLFVKISDAFGAHIAANGFSRPYLLAMAMGTALYGFGALWISFRIAKKYVPEREAFVATLGIWFASSLPVYMYFNVSWSHAHSAFMVALFLWYWLRTRNARTLPQWVILGAIGGLMMDVYYINAVLLVLPAAESLGIYFTAAKAEKSAILRTLYGNLLFLACLFVAFLPTLMSKRIIYGGYLRLGYNDHWYWKSPAFFKVAFSADHGLFSWTPILILSIIGLTLFVRRDRKVAVALLGAFLLYLYAIGCYQDWDGISSFGNRFFVSLTPIFVVGLAGFFDWLSGTMQLRRVALTVSAVTTALILFNFGLMFQWGTHLIPARGPVSWRTTAYNEVAVVPFMATGMLKSYFTKRSGLMNRIEQEDVTSLKSDTSGGLP